MYSIKGKTDHQPRLDAWDKCLGLVHWEDSEGWETHVNPWLIHVNVWQKPLQYCKVISLQLIKNKWKKKKESPIRWLKWKNQYCQNDPTAQGKLQIQCYPYQITNGIFHRTRTFFFLFLYLFFMDLHVFPIPIPPPTSLSPRSLWLRVQKSVLYICVSFYVRTRTFKKNLYGDTKDPE